MAISPYIANIRRKIGRDLLLLPTVAVLPRDEHGRILLVRLIDTERWATIGGAVEPDESPQDAAIREAQEEAGVTVELVRVVTVVGGRAYRLTYPNGDQAACVATVFEATVVSGEPAADDDETSAVGWFTTDEIERLDLNPLNRHLLREAIPLLSR